MLNWVLIDRRATGQPKTIEPYCISKDYETMKELLDNQTLAIRTDVNRRCKHTFEICCHGAGKLRLNWCAPGPSRSTNDCQDRGIKLGVRRSSFRRASDRKRGVARAAAQDAGPKTLGGWRMMGTWHSDTAVSNISLARCITFELPLKSNGFHLREKISRNLAETKI